MPAGSLVRRRHASARRTLVFGCLGFAALASSAARADPDPNSRAGIWTLNVGSNKHQCSMVLRTDPAGQGMGLAMPPGCRKALPDLKSVQSWSMPDDTLVSLNDAQGQAVLVFSSQGDLLHATDQQGGDLTLSRVDQGARPSDGSIVSLNPVTAGYQKAKAAKTGETQTAAATASPRPAPVTPGATAGNYAVLRGDRDTGCMVTLDASARGPKGTNKARLAPACRDQGITIFDPLGWQLQADALVLTARKGHTVKLELNSNGIWVKTPEDVKGLALKRL